MRLRLPATSANLGPGFDTLALALALYLEVEAVEAERFRIEVTGRNCDVCEQLEGNLLLDTYRRTVERHAGRPAPQLALRMHNGIPLGMGCGSSAASRLAGLVLASHFGELGWSGERLLAEAVRLEAHPDNAAACWYGGFVASAMDEDGLTPLVVPIQPPEEWSALVALPEAPLATTASRAVLPEAYSRTDVVRNLQRVALLTAAFAAGRGELLRTATGDSLHQPYRSAVCPLLAALAPLAGSAGVLSVTLSGAGPGVLLLVARGAEASAEALVRDTGGALLAEVVTCGLARAGAEVTARETAASAQDK